MKDSLKNWICNKKSELSASDKASSLTEKYNFSKIFLQILASRGYLTEEDIHNFLNPKLSNLLDPGLLPNIDTAVKRLTAAYKDKQRIIIYGDYDADGVISTAILYNFLKRAGFYVDYYIPDRFEEGYDINLNFIKEKVIPGNYNLVICVDCGTNSFEIKEFLKSSNNRIDVIVCDHHEPLNSPFQHSSKIINGTNNKEAKYIIVNPRLSGSDYPFKSLSGAGVTYKFIIHSLRSFDSDLKTKFSKDYLKSFIDLVAISTVADVMPLTDENRIIVYYGLKKITSTENHGLKRLLEKSCRNRTSFNTYDLGFIISPRLNASGRVRKASPSLELLIDAGNSPEHLDIIIDKIEAMNQERQKIQNEIIEEIINKKSFNPEDISENNRIFICSSHKWSEGVIGIVASHLVKILNVPVIVFKEKDGIFKGSGRSIPGFNLSLNLEKFRDYFIKFGGHSQACGITMKEELFKEFKKEITGYARKTISSGDIEKKYYYDMEIGFTGLGKNLLNEIEMMQPFGIDNPRPVFRTNCCEIVSEPVFTQGKRQDTAHVFFKLKNENKIFDAVIFSYLISKNKKAVNEKLKKGEFINILYCLGKKPLYSVGQHYYLNNNRYQSKTSGKDDCAIQLVIDSFC